MNSLKSVLLYKNHKGTIGTWQVEAFLFASGDAELHIHHAKKIGGAQVRSVVPITPKNVGKANETTPAQQAESELDSRVNSQIDKGYVRDLAAAAAPATNGLGLEKPMLAQPLAKVIQGSIDWANAFAQPKFDGHRCLSKGMLYSRGGKPINLPHIWEELNDIGLGHLHTDGELYVHGTLLQDIGSLITRKQEGTELIEYRLYDQISPAPYEERLAEITSIVASAGSSRIKVVPTFRVADAAAMDVYHRQFLKDGYEGSILRHGLTGYESDKRSNSLIKLKDFDDTEFLVIGYREGTPRTLEDGSVLRVPVWLLANPGGKTEKAKTFEVTAHGDMYEKDRQWTERDSYVGKLLTVQHFKYSKEMVPLIPVSLRWRVDL